MKTGAEQHGEKQHGQEEKHNVSVVTAVITCGTQPAALCL